MKKRMKIYLIIFTILFGGMALNGYGKDQNIALYRVVTHSSSVDANHCGHLVVDGSPNTYWEANSKDDNQWLLIDLGVQRKIREVKINWGENYAVSFKILLANVPKDPGYLIYESTEGAGEDCVVKATNTKARFVRLEVSSVRQSIRGCVIREIEVFGDGPERFSPSRVTSLSLNNLSLNGSIWRVQNAMFVKEKPELIANSNFNDRKWIPATVPGTIMGDYYKFGALPNPLYGDNMHQISDSFFSGNDFWYRTRVNIPTDLSGKRLTLNFSGINYKAEIYFNGKYLGRIDGGFVRGEFEITDFVNFSSENTIAVLVHHNNNWVSGTFKVIKKSLGDRTTNGDMLGLDGPTCLASAGWNWLPIVKGRNIGIWNNVSLIARGDVSINDPWVTSVLPLPDTTKADLTIHTSLKNNSSKTIEGKLLATFENREIELPVTLAANEKKVFSLEKSQFKELSLKKPKLWWPNGYGEQNLEKLKLEFVENGKISESKTINFGIRQLDYKTN